MDWDDVKFFLAVYRARTSAGAARALGVQHSTVGRRLAALEQVLGARLFLRDHSGFIPTDAAEAIVEIAEDMERGAAGIVRALDGRDTKIEGKVRLTCSDAFAGYLFSHLHRLRDVHPLLHVEILAGNTIFDIQKGQADIAVRMVPTKQPDLICRKLVKASWSLYASDSYLSQHGEPMSPKNLFGHQVIGFDESLAGSPGARWLAEHSEDAYVPLRANSIGAVVEAADAGAGLAMMPCFLADGKPHLRRLFADLAERRAIWLAFREDVAKIARVRTVIDFVVATIVSDRALFEGTKHEDCG